MKPLAFVLMGMLLCGCARAVEPQPFDYWLLALSWSPQYCAETTRSNEAQCDTRRPYGFIVHGLWPQKESSRVENCPRAARLPERLVQRLLPLMPSAGLIQYQWNKHGSCTGWPAEDYVRAIEQAWAAVRIPAAYVAPQDYLSTDLRGIERAFQAVNPAFNGAAVAVQCSGNYLKEVRLCLDKDYHARACDRSVRDRCGGQVVLRPAK